MSRRGHRGSIGGGGRGRPRGSSRNLDYKVAAADGLTTADLLAQHASILNAHWPDTTLADAYVLEHSDNPNFCELATLSRKLKSALLE